MDKRNIIRQAQTTDTNGELYTLTDYDDGTVGCTCSSSVKQGPLPPTDDRHCEHVNSYRQYHTIINVPGFFYMGGVVLYDDQAGGVLPDYGESENSVAMVENDFDMTPDKYTPNAVGAFIIALSRVFAEIDTQSQQNRTTSFFLAHLERELETSIENLPELTPDEENTARWLRGFLQSAVQVQMNMINPADPE